MLTISTRSFTAGTHLNDLRGIFAALSPINVAVMYCCDSNACYELSTLDESREVIGTFSRVRSDDDNNRWVLAFSNPAGHRVYTNLLREFCGVDEIHNDYPQ